ncbi:MAG: hypothetical protein WCN98_10500 [Verrucomicrobiaceae bacterium]
MEYIQGKRESHECARDGGFEKQNASSKLDKPDLQFTSIARKSTLPL